MNFKFYIILLLSSFYSFIISGQELKYDIKEMEIYSKDKNLTSIILRMDFGKWEIKHAENFAKVLDNKIIKEIDILFTLYPFKIDEWKKEYHSLLRNRLLALASISPELLNNKNIKYNIILQTQGTTEIAARKLLHGIVLKYSSDTKKDSDIFKSTFKQGQAASLEQIQKINNEVAAIVYGLSKFSDSTVLKVIQRNAWKNLTVVTDWTGSMYAYGAQLVLWHRLNFEQNNIHGYVFFNDGNRKLDKQKVAGKTGGVIFCKPPSIDSLLSIMNFVAKLGQGGDIQENNIEALLKGIKNSGPENEIVMIADNLAGVRDMSFLHKIKRPVRIILSGAPCGVPIHPHYLEIARYTGGSIHTIEQDIMNIFEIKYGHYFDINGVKYKKLRGKLMKA